MITWGRVYWPIAMVGVFLFFVPAELYALFTNANNTLSDYSWHELDITKAFEISGNGVAWWASFISWIIFVIIISLHIWYRSV
jgi:hypothetical protein